MDIDWPQRVLDLVDWLAIKLVDGRLVYDTGTTDALLRHNEPFFRSIRVTYEFLRKAFRLTPNMIRPHPVLAAMMA